MDTPGQEPQLGVTYAVVVALLALVVAAPLVIIGLVIGGIWWLLGLVVGLAFGTGLVWHWRRSAVDRVLRSFTASGVEPMAEARLENLIEGLSLSIGTSEPELLIVADEAMNAMAVAGANREVVVITTSMASDLGRIELEGVVAELLVRLKTGDAATATALASVVGLPLMESPLASATRSLGASLLRRNLDEHRDILADRQAVAVTRYPPGLSAGLDRVANGPLTPGAATPGTDHLWMVPPPRLGSVVPLAPIDWRVEALMEI